MPHADRAWPFILALIIMHDFLANIQSQTSLDDYYNVWFLRA